MHDKERTHSCAFTNKKCASEAYKANVDDIPYLEEMGMVNKEHAHWLKRSLETSRS